MCWLLRLCFISVVTTNLCNANRPHVIFIVADDLGWNDVSWHNPSMFTPNLESLAKEGVILNQSYVQPVCTPSRTAFMTGYYPYRVGRQNHVITPLEPTGVSLNFTLLPQRLKKLGYDTHIVGKWHLGYCNWSYTPTHRGFDSFFGYYNGAEDYYAHSLSVKDRVGETATWRYEPLYLDFRNDTRPSRKYNGVYSANVFAKAVVQILSKSNPNKPLFIYLPFQSVHAPLEVPIKWEKMYSHIKDANRRKYCGMVSAMDDAVGQVVSGLKKYGFLENTVIIFTTDLPAKPNGDVSYGLMGEVYETDNRYYETGYARDCTVITIGAQVPFENDNITSKHVKNGGQTKSGGNNWPLRGNKATLWEGGTRGIGFVYSKLLKEKAYVNEKLIHAVDWYPTILYLAGNRKGKSSMDGVNQWKVISENDPAARSEFIYNIYDVGSRRAAIRVGDFKLIWGFPGNPSGWIPPPNEEIETNGTQCKISKTKHPALRLYNIKDDPTERKNLAKHLPQVAELLRKKIVMYSKMMVPADDPDDDPQGDPSNWGGVFTPGWCVAH